MANRSRRAALLGSLFMALALGAQPAAAANVIHQSGDYGTFVFTDDSTHLGAYCEYETHKTNGAYLLDDISIRAPKVFALDTGGGTQHQKVGWKYKIQQDVPPLTGEYNTIFTSSVDKALATDATSAAFTRRTWTADEHPKGNYRVEVSLYWFDSQSGHVAGKVIADIVYMQARKTGSSPNPRMNSCYQAF